MENLELASTFWGEGVLVNKYSSTGRELEMVVEILSTASETPPGENQNLFAGGVSLCTASHNNYAHRPFPRSFSRVLGSYGALELRANMLLVYAL